ncbi:hypothetical protein NTGM5_790018 [Candidatus Nitrotoga sp. M5]|nr:hypothetical protein NTGM5_790018 [Candidatus Nitrotoga sp. M5]
MPRAACRDAIAIAKIKAAASARLTVEDAGMGEGLVTIRVRVCGVKGPLHVTT